jgi:toxin FitB
LAFLYLLDTNVISELRKQRPHGGVLAWIQSVPDAQLFISAVTVGEIQAGIEITREQDAPKAEAIENWLQLIAKSYQVLPADAQVFRRWAQLLHRKSNHHLEDALIAATAMEHGLTVVTRNTKDFKQFGLNLFNPFN